TKRIDDAGSERRFRPDDDEIDLLAACVSHGLRDRVGRAPGLPCGKNGDGSNSIALLQRLSNRAGPAVLSDQANGQHGGKCTIYTTGLKTHFLNSTFGENVQR